MFEYLIRYHTKLEKALLEHLGLVLITMAFSFLLAFAVTMLAEGKKYVASCFIQFAALIYSVPSLALFAMLIPLLGIGRNTAVFVLVLYNQYILLNNFIGGLNQVDPIVIEAAKGMGMSQNQILFQIKIPLAKASLFAGVRLALVSTIGIATIAATINAGGLGRILFEGIRTMHVGKILWGSVFVTLLAICMNAVLSGIEKRLGAHTHYF